MVPYQKIRSNKYSIFNQNIGYKLIDSSTFPLEENMNKLSKKDLGIYLYPLENVTNPPEITLTFRDTPEILFRRRKESIRI